MSVYFVTGGLGSGKGLAALHQIKNYADNGSKIAGNLDIFLDKLIPNPQSKVTYIRVPDRPTQTDLLALGNGNSGYDPDENSLLVLDECATWLNARNWNDKGRASLIDWLLHSRKHGWDVLLLVQSFETLDKQIVDSLMEYHVSMNNLGKFNIPLIGKFLKGYTKTGRPLKLPKYHFGRVMYKNLVKADSWMFSGKEYYTSYDTKQIFTEKNEFCSHSLLSNWHLTGRYLPKKQKHIIIKYISYNLLKLLFKITKTDLKHIPRIPQMPLKPSKPSPSHLYPPNLALRPLEPLKPQKHHVEGFDFYSL